MTALPIDAVLPEIAAALAAGNAAVLVAPPGAGKTTRVPLALLSAPWRGDKKILLLSPRRLAARAAAQRMADTLGEPVGKTVGYRMRLDSKISADTKIEVITEALLTRRILAEPDLPDVAAILFDEFHERSLDGDLGLALALDVQANLREDLRLLPMSATLDGARVAALLDNCPLIESQGRLFRVDLRHTGREARARLEPQIVQIILRALREETGSLLVFLPGAAEINGTARLLAEAKLPAHVSVHPLMGQLELRAQQEAIAPAKSGARKIVLATSIAETSLTIEGVRVVIDCGLSRRAKYDPGSGLTRLVTERVSQASATQRAGRAGRLEPGVCYRLWDAAENRGLIAFDPPEIKSADLAALVLTLATWGPATLKWLDAPPVGAWQQSTKLLQQLGALDVAEQITPHGRTISEIPAHPRLAHMLMTATARGFGGVAAHIAALLGEPGVGGNHTDLSTRLTNLRREKSARAEGVMRLAQNWAKQTGAKIQDGTIEDAARALALAYPDRIAKARGSRGSFLLASGQGAMLDETDALARAPWIVVADSAGSAERARILLAAEIAEADVRDIAAAHITTTQEVRIEGKSNRSESVSITRLGAITLSEVRMDNADPDILQAALLTFIRQRGLTVLPWTEHWKNWCARLHFLHEHAPDAWPSATDDILQTELETWLAPYLAGRTRLSELSSEDLGHALQSRLDSKQVRALETQAPARLTTPAGTSHAIDYGAPGGPAVTCRVQELFGLSQHPVVAGNIPIALILLSPGHRPIQTTKDLPGFWRGSWAAVKSEMKGRYPKHVWPDDPAAAAATTRAKPRGT